ncbi:MAG: hypothetical protein GYA15_02300 [Leptolinea sp.]|jgi:hypothetical protein|nr:hypothetical protein [Leptolinea sp.]
METWAVGLLVFFRTTSQILSAGIAITAFSLVLYGLTFNLRDRVARTFALIMISVAVVFTGQSLASTSTEPVSADFWLQFSWMGITVLPAFYLNFSDAILATTGRPSRWRRKLAIRTAYLASLVFLITLPLGLLVGESTSEIETAPHLRPTIITGFLFLYYAVAMVMAWINFVRAYLRTTTPTSRRRMVYLITGALAPALGSFPFLLYNSQLALEHNLAFWSISAISNLVVGGLIVLMAYAVAFFGHPWPDRVVKSRLLKWIIRGPVTAIITLGLMTIVRRAGNLMGNPYTGMVPFVMVCSILLCEFFVTLLSPLWERVLFYGKDQKDLVFINNLEQSLVTRNDLSQFLEMILAAVQDRLQSRGAFIAAINGEGMELVSTTGKIDWPDENSNQGDLVELVKQSDEHLEIFEWNNALILPLHTKNADETTELLGLLGVTGTRSHHLEPEQKQSLDQLAARATVALRDRHIQQQLFQSFEKLTSDINYLSELRAAGRYEPENVLDITRPVDEELTIWVRDALTHYWGGPRLTESPLLNLTIIQDMLEAHDGNYPNTLRTLLKNAIEKVRPGGERRFTGEWILYNILEMKFLEGKKVREIATKLAMSEADLYRKQRVALEAVAREITQMEKEARDSHTD